MMSVLLGEKTEALQEYNRDLYPENKVFCDACGFEVPVSLILENIDNNLKVNTFDYENIEFLSVESNEVFGYSTPDNYHRWHRINVIRFFCYDCVAICDDCGDYNANDNLVSITSGESVCEACWDNYFTCEYCDNNYHTDNAIGVDGGNSLYCRNCTSDFAFWCEPCDTYHSENTHCADYDAYHDSDYSESDTSLIRSYSYKPQPVFHQKNTTDDSKLFFGLELEVEAEQADRIAGAQLVRDRLGDFVYLKNDGSLNHGFEIVTHPFNFEYYRGINFGFIDELREMGFRSWDSGTCGLHIHISRKGFSSAGHIWRFANLIINNPKEWQKLAGRNSRQWATYDKERNNIGKNLTGKSYPERYCAVNMCNSATIEVRIFRGSLNKTRIGSAIESMHAAVEYTRSLSVQDVAAGALGFDRFAAWVLWANEYGNLNDLMEAKQLITKKVGQ